MLHRFPMTSQQINAAILVGSLVSLAVCVVTAATSSSLSFSFLSYLLFALGVSVLAAKKNSEARKRYDQSLAKIAALRREEEVMRERLHELDLAQMSKYSAELQHLPEAQRIVAIHQAMEAWKALGSP